MMIVDCSAYGPGTGIKPKIPERCPRCDSTQPHLHPTVQCEGEVEICTHDFHLIPTPQNTPEYINGVLAKRNR